VNALEINGAHTPESIAGVTEAFCNDNVEFPPRRVEIALNA